MNNYELKDYKIVKICKCVSCGKELPIYVNYTDNGAEVKKINESAIVEMIYVKRYDDDKALVFCCWACGSVPENKSFVGFPEVL